MKKLVGILLSVSMVFSVGATALAAPNADLSVDEEETDGVVVEDAADYENVTVEYHEGLSLDLSYDDRYDLSELEGISSDTQYVIYKTEYTQGQGITSHQVSQGKDTGVADEALLTLKAEDSTDVVATGVGSGTVWLVRADQEEELRKALEENPDGENPDGENPDGENPDGENPDGENPDGENPDGENPKETIDVYEIAVTVAPAPLTLMFLTGQSNMEGYCDSYTGYTMDTSIACEEGRVYSTYVPWGTDKGKEITGIDFGEVCSVSNYGTTSGDFVPGSLQGMATEGTLCAPSNMSGGMLEYPLDSLTSAGGGKTGPDSGLAYEWNQLTQEKVWVVNTAYGSTDIVQWVPGGNCYERSVSVWKQVLQTYNAELDAGHYTAGDRLVFWQQGETGDATNLTATEYEDSFDMMYQAMSEEIDMDAFGIFMVRAGQATNGGSDYRSEKDLMMTGPRIAQYWLGSGNSSYDTVYVATNANEQWVSDSKVKSYFQDQYGSALSYPTQNGSTSLPTTVNEVHYNIHYSQIGHNENGITAAYGMHEALSGSSTTDSISWRDADGKTISSLMLELATDTAIAVPVAEPVYTSKQLVCPSVSGSVISYDASSGIVKAADAWSVGTEDITAVAGGINEVLPVTVSTPLDLSGVAGNYTGLYEYNGIWWYLKNGIVQTDYEGVEKNTDGWWYVKNGRIDLTYTGFAENSNGWWYIENGKVTFNKTDVIKDTDAKIDGAQTWWYVEGSKVQFDYTGFAENSNGWWYIENGKVTFNKTSVIKDTNAKIDGAQTWWYVEGSKVQFSYTGFAENSNGKWYIEEGKVTFAKNGVLKDTAGAIGTTGTWYYVLESKVQTSYTGVADYQNENGWWYIQDGMVDFTANTVAKNSNGWWYVRAGKVDFSYTGFGENDNGKWYLEGGKVTFAKNSVLKDTTGAIGTTGTWYYVVGSKVQVDFTGLADYSNENGWWYIQNGEVDFTVNTVAKNKNGWWYVTGGKVQFGFTGLADYSNANGWWYIKSGKVDFTHSGVDRNQNGWWYTTDGKVDFSYNGIAENSNGWWYIQNGKVDFSYSGEVTVSGITYPVTAGRVAR